jgi:hypothetical protein
MYFVRASHPEHHLVDLSVLLDLDLGFPLDLSGLLGLLDLGFPLGLSGPLGHHLAYSQFSQLESLSARLR